MYFRTVLINFIFLVTFFYVTFAIAIRKPAPSSANGTVEEECQCLLNHHCDPDYKVARVNCSNSAFTCCKRPYATRFPIQNCTCVLSALCLDQDTKESGTGALIPKRLGEKRSFCQSTSDICCPNNKILHPPVPTTATSPASEIASEECRCVIIQDCSSTYLESGVSQLIPKIGKCMHPRVCCPPDQLNGSPTTVIPSTRYNTSSPVILSPTTPFPQSVSAGTLNPENCGKRVQSEKGRIFGPNDWTETDFGEFPWMALILRTNEELIHCGGSLLSESLILTAAHCVYGMDKHEIKIRAGEYTRSQDDPKPHQDRFVERITIHENYTERGFYNDMALIKVTEDFQFDVHIYPTCVPEKGSWYAENTIYDPNACVATGWGKKNFDDVSYPNTLRKADLMLVSNEECQSALRQNMSNEFFKVHSSFVCARGLYNSDTCPGDGGGPLVCSLRNDRTRFVQVGIVAVGLKCGQPVPALYASLEANMEWLTDTASILNYIIPGIFSSP